MAPPSSHTLQGLANETGYHQGTLEKVLRLLDLLDGIAGDAVLSDRLALKGGTALNVFYFNLDRLSIDIDLNYIGALERAAMERERTDVDAAIRRLLASHGYDLRFHPREHAGGKWLSRFESTLGGSATLELDVNYMARQPLFGATRMASRPIGDFQVNEVLVLDLHEIVAGKITALFDRCAARDLFDARRILSNERLNWRWIKAAVLALGACARHDWRNRSVDALNCAPQEVRQKLAICLSDDHFAQTEDVRRWISETVEFCQSGLSFLFDLSADEQAFLDGVIDRGEVRTDLLNVEPEIQARIGAMPMLAWKTLNVRKRISRGS